MEVTEQICRFRLQQLKNDYEEVCGRSRTTAAIVTTTPEPVTATAATTATGRTATTAPATTAATAATTATTTATTAATATTATTTTTATTSTLQMPTEEGRSNATSGKSICGDGGDDQPAAVVAQSNGNDATAFPTVSGKEGEDGERSLGNRDAVFSSLPGDANAHSLAASFPHSSSSSCHVSSGIPNDINAQGYVLLPADDVNDDENVEDNDGESGEALRLAGAGRGAEAAVAILSATKEDKQGGPQSQETRKNAEKEEEEEKRRSWDFESQQGVERLGQQHVSQWQQQQQQQQLQQETDPSSSKSFLADAELPPKEGTIFRPVTKPRSGPKTSSSLIFSPSSSLLTSVTHSPASSTSLSTPSPTSASPNPTAFTSSFVPSSAPAAPAAPTPSSTSNSSTSPPSQSFSSSSAGQIASTSPFFLPDPSSPPPFASPPSTSAHQRRHHDSVAAKNKTQPAFSGTVGRTGQPTSVVIVEPFEVSFSDDEKLQEEEQRRREGGHSSTVEKREGGEVQAGRNTPASVFAFQPACLAPDDRQTIPSNSCAAFEDVGTSKGKNNDNNNENENNINNNNERCGSQLTPNRCAVASGTPLPSATAAETFSKNAEMRGEAAASGFRIRCVGGEEVPRKAAAAETSAAVETSGSASLSSSPSLPVDSSSAASTASSASPLLIKNDLVTATTTMTFPAAPSSTSTNAGRAAKEDWGVVRQTMARLNLSEPPGFGDRCREWKELIEKETFGDLAAVASAALRQFPGKGDDDHDDDD